MFDRFKARLSARKASTSAGQVGEHHPFSLVNEKNLEEGRCQEGRRRARGMGSTHRIYSLTNWLLHWYIELICLAEIELVFFSPGLGNVWRYPYIGK